MRVYAAFCYGERFVVEVDCELSIPRFGVNQQHAAAWNGSGEFWPTNDHHRAEWFALPRPNSLPAACSEFDLPESVLLVILQMNPPGAIHHAPKDYEFLPGSHALLNQHMTNKQVVPVP